MPELAESADWSRVADDQHFEVPGFNGVASCRLQVLRSSRQEVLFVATQMSCEEGTSLINVAERFIERAWNVHAPDTHHPPPMLQYIIANGKPPWDDSDIAWLDDNGQARWRQPTPAEWAIIVAHAEVDRGGTYVSPPAPVEHSQLIWIEVPLSNFPPTRPFRTTCMRRPVRQTPRRRRLFRRPDRHLETPPSLTSDCCWYHSVNWIEVNRALRPALRDLEDMDLDSYSDLQWQLEERLLAAQVQDEIRYAAQSLVRVPIYLYSDFTDYTNGQHRAQAMLDQQVDSTLVVINVDIAQLDAYPGRFRLPHPRG